MLITVKDIPKINKLKALLNNEFEIKDLGATKKIHKMMISRNQSEGKLYLSQAKYIEKVLKNFNMWDVKPIHTIFATHFKCSNLSP